MDGPKFKIGQTVHATWAGGSVTLHIIEGIEMTRHGYWYIWDDEGRKSGLHERYISA